MKSQAVSRLIGLGLMMHDSTGGGTTHIQEEWLIINNDWCCTIKTKQKRACLCSLANYRWIHTRAYIYTLFACAFSSQIPTGNQTNLNCFPVSFRAFRERCSHNTQTFLNFFQKLVLIVLHIEHVVHWYIKYGHLAVSDVQNVFWTLFMSTFLVSSLQW